MLFVSGQVSLTPRYEEAVEGSSWAISGQCRWWASKQWVPASVELVMVGSRRSQVQDATLLLHYSLSVPAVVSTSGDDGVVIVV